MSALRRILLEQNTTLCLRQAAKQVIICWLLLHNPPLAVPLHRNRSCPRQGQCPTASIRCLKLSSYKTTEPRVETTTSPNTSHISSTLTLDLLKRINQDGTRIPRGGQRHNAPENPLRALRRHEAVGQVGARGLPPHRQVRLPRRQGRTAHGRQEAARLRLGKGHRGLLPQVLRRGEHHAQHWAGGLRAGGPGRGEGRVWRGGPGRLQGAGAVGEYSGRRVLL